MIGAIAGIVLAPFMAPAWGFRLLVERLHEEANAVMYDEGRGLADLLELSMHHKAGRISDAEFATREAELLARLSAMREPDEPEPDEYDQVFDDEHADGSEAPAAGGEDLAHDGEVVAP